MRRPVSKSNSFRASAIEEMRQVGRDGDDRLRTAPDEAKSLRHLARLGVANEDRQDLERGRRHGLQHHQMHFERMFACEGPRVDAGGAGFREAQVEVARDLRFAERRAARPWRGGSQARGRRPGAPGRRSRSGAADRRARPRGQKLSPRPRRNRQCLHAARRRPWARPRRPAGRRCDIRDQRAEACRLRRVEKPRHLRGMNLMALHVGPQSLLECRVAGIPAPESRIAFGRRPPEISK